MKSAVDAETWVLVLDGAKAMMFRNEGFDDAPVLQLVEERAYDSKLNRDLGSDRPGRLKDGPGAGRSAVENADLHDLAEADFVKDVAAWLNESARKKAFDRIAVFADPRSLGRLRGEIGNDVRERLIGERVAGLTKTPLPEIEKAFSALAAKAG